MWYEFSQQECFVLAAAVGIACNQLTEEAVKDRNKRPHIAKTLVELQKISRKLYDDGVPYKPDI